MTQEPLHGRHGTKAMHEMRLRVWDKELSFDAACDLAKQEASRLETEMMLLAWFDRKAGKEYPVVPECLHQPGWVAYAESRGANLKVVINDGEYIFLFCPVEKG